MIVRSAVILDPAQCAALARLAGEGVRRARARGEIVGVDALAVVDELATVGRAFRVASAAGNTELPQVVEPVDPVDDVCVKQAAPMLGVTDRRVRQLIVSGRLSARKSGGHWYVSTVDVERLARTRKATAKVP